MEQKHFVVVSTVGGKLNMGAMQLLDYGLIFI